MTEFAVPVWGSFSIIGVLLGIVGTIVTLIIRGSLITGKRQDQIDADHKAELAAQDAKHAAELEAVRAEAAVLLAAAERRSEKWQEAYQASQSVQAQTTVTLSKVTSLTEVFESFLNVLRQMVPLKGSDNGET